MELLVASSELLVASLSFAELGTAQPQLVFLIFQSFYPPKNNKKLCHTVNMSRSNTNFPMNIGALHVGERDLVRYRCLAKVQ